jgi:hypothetical protein
LKNNSHEQCQNPLNQRELQQQQQQQQQRQQQERQQQQQQQMQVSQLDVFNAEHAKWEREIEMLVAKIQGMPSFAARELLDRLSTYVKKLKD